MTRSAHEFPWNDEHVAALRRYVDNRMSGSAIAKQLSADFSFTVSRNSVVGKAMRLGISLNSGFKGGRTPKVAKDEPRKRPKRRGPPEWHEASHAEAASAKPVEAPRAIPPAPNSKPVDLMGLTNTTCRWPITDDNPHMFCGALEADLNEGRAYCAIHTAFARNHRQSREAA